MPHRVIRHEFIRSHSLMRVSRDARLTMALLILAVDDAGRMEASPAGLKADLYPLDDDVSKADLERWLEELIEQGCVQWYWNGPTRYLFMPNWTDHDTKRRKLDSKLPEPPPRNFPKVSETSRSLPKLDALEVGVGEGSRNRELDTGEGGTGGDGAPAPHVSGQSSEPVTTAPQGDPASSECLPGCERAPGHRKGCAKRSGPALYGWEALAPRRAAYSDPPEPDKPAPPKARRKPGTPEWAMECGEVLYAAIDGALPDDQVPQGTAVLYGREFASWKRAPPPESITLAIRFLFGLVEFESRGNRAREAGQGRFNIMSARGIREKWPGLWSAVQDELRAPAKDDLDPFRDRAEDAIDLIPRRGLHGEQQFRA